MKKLTKIKIEEIEPLFCQGDKVILKDNLLNVEIGDITIKKGRYYYKVRYSHMYWENRQVGWFFVYEDELELKPDNYESLLMSKYIEYKQKYENLCYQLANGYRPR